MESYKNHRKAFNNKLSQIRIDKNSEKIHNSTNKNKTLWGIVNKRLGRKKKENEIEIYHNNCLITDKLLTSNIFAHYFSNSPKEKINEHFENNLSLECTIAPITSNTFFFQPASPEEICDIISKMHNKKYKGSDDIPVALLKYSKNIISESLSKFMNLSIELGQFPDALKIGKVIPIFKKGDKQNIINYRPIVLLSHISKISEKILTSRIYDFLECHQLLTKHQYGYRSNRSTELSCIDFIQNIYEGLDKGMKVIGLFFDLTAAFDVINTKFLCSKLYNLGIRGNVLNWIQSYLSNRKIFVSIDAEESEMTDIDIGVGQESILGPLLFLMFINDMPQYLHRDNIFMYADDTSIIVQSESIEDLKIQVQRVTTDFKEWCWKIL